MAFRLMVLVAALAGGVFPESVRAQEPYAAPQPDGISWPQYFEDSTEWSFFLRASHVRERQPLPLGLLKACRSPEATTKQFMENALLWVLSLPLHCQLLPPEIVADEASNSRWSVRTWQELYLLMMLQPSLTRIFLLPRLAEAIFETKADAANPSWEIGVGLANFDASATSELCWRHFAAASRGGSRNEVELTFLNSVVATEDYRFSHVEALCWSENRLRRRVLQGREYYLGHGLAIRFDIGFTSDLGGSHTEAETMFSLVWYPTEGTMLHIGYDLFRHRLQHGGTMVW